MGREGRERERERERERGGGGAIVKLSYYQEQHILSAHATHRLMINFGEDKKGSYCSSGGKLHTEYCCAYA